MRDFPRPVDRLLQHATILRYVEDVEDDRDAMQASWARGWPEIAAQIDRLGLTVAEAERMFRGATSFRR